MFHDDTNIKQKFTPASLIKNIQMKFDRAMCIIYIQLMNTIISGHPIILLSHIIISTDIVHADYICCQN